MDIENLYLDCENPYMVLDSPYLDFENPHMDLESPYMDFENLYMDRENTYMDFENLYMDFENTYMDFENLHLNALPLMEEPITPHGGGPEVCTRVLRGQEKLPGSQNRAGCPPRIPRAWLYVYIYICVHIYPTACDSPATGPWDLWLNGCWLVWLLSAQNRGVGGWGVLGALGRGVLGALGGILGSLGGVLGVFGAILAASERSWAFVGSNLGGLGPVLALFCGVLGASWLQEGGSWVVLGFKISHNRSQERSETPSFLSSIWTSILQRFGPNWSPSWLPKFVKKRSKLGCWFESCFWEDFGTILWNSIHNITWPTPRIHWPCQYEIHLFDLLLLCCWDVFLFDLVSFLDFGV